MKNPQTTVAGVAAILWAIFDLWHSNGANGSADMAAISSGIIGILAADGIKIT